MSYLLSSVLTYGTAAAMLAALNGSRPGEAQHPTSMPAASSASDTAAVVDQRPSAEALAVVDFWREAGPGRWFAKDPEFDRTFRERFLSLHEAATRGELVDWLATPEGALALVLLLDQFPRNAFRDTPRMYDTDAWRARWRDAAIAAGHDRRSTSDCRSSSICRSVIPRTSPTRSDPSTLNRRLGEPNSDARRAPPRHHPALRPLPASQSDSRTADAAGGAAVPRRRRLRGLTPANGH